MPDLQLSIAIGPYDRMMPLVRGEVRIDAVDPQFMLLEPEEIFFRAMRHEAFDICELSLSVRTTMQVCRDAREGKTGTAT